MARAASVRPIERIAWQTDGRRIEVTGGDHCPEARRPSVLEDAARQALVGNLRDHIALIGVTVTWMIGRKGKQMSAAA